MRGRVLDELLSVTVGDLYLRGVPRRAAPLPLRGPDRLGQVWLQLVAERDSVTYEGRRVDREGVETTFEGCVKVEWERANLGGLRAEFLCPRRSCQRVSRRLFLVGGSFACVWCADVRYASRRRPVDPHERRLGRIAELRARLGDGPADWDAPLPDRPKGMHVTTYDRLSLELADLIGVEQKWVNVAINSGELSFRSEVRRLLARKIKDEQALESR